ncbi:hypothetical protein EDC40_108128 [Aminobacter aminovorans]|uniref:Phytanoyl-CoA dioxygenase (PhyH) n=1 Tax=Aminobacter aminovorans TaxID=83263 RepID=A0A381INH7_AMIAI|nr:hypothetical protein [Aminobacter aminovorans]TCS24589.1 hypothetical protein EDC40_108128 [Aminobacter aminovorans]SUY29455.1 Uncharacterised protein [Aminobacter aminovorans]
MYSNVTQALGPRVLHDRIYAGDILRFGTLASMTDLVSYSQAFLEDAFAPFAPVEIHRHLSHDQQTESFAQRQRDFARSPEVRRLWRDVFEACGLDAQGLARDALYLRFQPHQDPGAVVPRARTTATIAFHRDTWGSNLYAQTNWWAPVYDIDAGRTFAIYPSLWDRPVANTSADFDLGALLERSKAGGRNAVDADAAIPHLTEELEVADATPVVIAPGEIIAFSSAHAHAGVPNSTGLTRISLETRTLWIDDVRSGRGAPNVDGFARWMSPGMFRRVSDETPLHEILGMNRIERFAGPIPARPVTAP